MDLAEQSGLVLDRAQHPQAPGGVDRVRPERNPRSVGGDDRQPEEPCGGSARGLHRLQQNRPYSEPLSRPRRWAACARTNVQQPGSSGQLTGLGQPSQSSRAGTATAGCRDRVLDAELLDGVCGPARDIVELCDHRSNGHNSTFVSSDSVSN
jgi:hypothetical protein